MRAALVAFLSALTAAHAARVVPLGKDPEQSSAKQPRQAWRDLWHSGGLKERRGWCPKSSATLLARGGSAGGSKAAEVGSQAPPVAATPPPPKPACAGTLVGGFYPELTWQFTCCTATDLSCAGCGFWANGVCEQCAAGYVKQKGVCVTCDDMPNWEDADGLTCSDYERMGNCSAGSVVSGRDKPFKGLSASDACCSCGGGERSPTPWRYPVSSQALVYGESIGSRGMPSPMTAGRHEVQADCGLKALGLSLSSNGTLTGTLPRYESGEQTVNDACVVTSIQEELEGVETPAELKITVQPMSYGPKVIVFRFVGDSEVPLGQMVWTLNTAADLGMTAPVSYEADCMPAAPWLLVDPATGALQYQVSPHAHGGGLSGAHSGFESTQCLLKARDSAGVAMSSVFSAVKVFLWAGAYYPATVFARKGRPIAAMQLWRQAPMGFQAHFDKTTGRMSWVKRDNPTESISVPPAMRPEVQGVKCIGAPPNQTIKWSRQTGLVTLGGQSAFIIDPMTGDISGVSEVALPARMGKASLALSCAVALGGELYDHAMTVRVGVQLEDNTCWYEAAAKEPVFSVLGAENATKPCSLQCLSKADCGMFFFDEEGHCVLQSSGGADAISRDPVKVQVRSLCEEGVSCLELKDSGTSFLEGKYCPKVRQQLNRCFRPTADHAEKVECRGPGYIMYTMREKKRRFELNNEGHFVCAYTASMKWFTESGEFIPEATDVIVAEVTPATSMVTDLKGTGGVIEGVRMGYSTGDLSFSTTPGGALTVDVGGTGFEAWECGDVSTAVFSRDGVNAWDMVFMARGPCPIPGKGGSWVLRRSNESDYVNPEEGDMELRGELLACIDEDVEYQAFDEGTGRSTLWLPDSAFTEPYYDPAQKLNNASNLSIGVTLLTDSCPSPKTEEVDFTFGTTTVPHAYSLDVCECFGESYRNTEPVTAASRKAVKMDPNKPFNTGTPEPQLLLEGPYTCEASSVLVNGQKNEITEEQCEAECRSNDGCRYFSYVPQLRYCLLHRDCERLGHTGLEVMHKVFGLFDEGSSWCRIADPEACWAKKHRRALLEGQFDDSEAGCAFQPLLAQCDLLHMATTEAHGECKRCEYYRLGSQPSQGLDKEPLPENFPGGKQLSVSCDPERGRLLSLTSRNQLDSSVITCVGGEWVDEDGRVGLDKLSCASCVQAAQPNYNKLLKASAPEVYFMQRRNLQYHYGVKSKGCRLASVATQAPLMLAHNDLCLQAEEGSSTVRLVAAANCSTKWYFSKEGKLQMGGADSRCLGGDRWYPKATSCDQSGGWQMHWTMDPMHRLRTKDKCMFVNSEGKPRLASCGEEIVPPRTKAWYFDGGDCRYRLELRGSERPLTWRFELHGGATLGSQTHASESGSEPEDLMDPMSYATCRVSLSAATASADKNLRQVLQLNYDPAAPEELGSVRAMMATMEGRALFSCPPGGTGGPERIVQMRDQEADMREQLRDLERQCLEVKKSGRYEDKSFGECPKDTGCAWGDGRISSRWGVLDRIRSRPRGHYRRRRNKGDRRRTVNRDWRLGFKHMAGNAVTLQRRRISYSSWGESRFNIQCPRNTIAWRLETSKVPCRRRRAAPEMRKFRFHCARLRGLNPNAGWNVQTHQWSTRDEVFEYNAKQHEFIVGMESKSGGDPWDQEFRVKTVQVCGSKTEKIEEKKKQIAAIVKKIKETSKEEASCAKDMDLPVDEVSSVDIGYYYSSMRVNSRMELKCHLLHRGLDEEAKEADYTMSAGQLTSIARAIAYHTVKAGDHKDEPFASAQGSVMSAQKVGWFAYIDNGATVWGLHCDRGSVVTVHSMITSPHCVAVGAGTSHVDVVINAAVPGSGQCNLGQAVGGWYNLPGVKARRMDRSVGGPEVPTGFTLYCRDVPGLSRMCEEKEAQCELDEVVTGIRHELGMTIKYRCCKVPKTVGHIFSDKILRGIQPYEGYYCPNRLDETGRPEFTLTSRVGTEAARAQDRAQVLTGVSRPRATALGSIRGGSLRAWADHKVYCKAGEVLQQFRVERSGLYGLDNMRASYTCLRLPMAPSDGLGLRRSGCVLQETTPFAEYGAHPQVRCSDMQALAGFRLEGPPAEEPAAEEEGSSLLEKGNSSHRNVQYKFKYYCCDVPLEPTTTRISPKTDFDEAEFYDVESQDVACKEDEIMQGFQAERDGRQISHTIKCAKPKVNATELEPDEESRKLTWDKFQGVWKLWKEGGFNEPEAALASSAADPTEASDGPFQTARVEPPGYSGGNATSRFWLNGLEIESARGQHAVVLAPGSHKVKEERNWTLAGAEGESAALAEYLNGLVQGTVVLLAFSGEELSGMAPAAFFALQRLGATVHVGERGGAYALIGAAGGAAVSEGLPNEAVEGQIPHVAIAPIVTFDAAFVTTVEKPDPFPKYRPMKPKLLHFQPTKPEYDQFCDLNKRNFEMDGIDCEEEGACPEDEHPCAHTFQNQITEQKFWNCQQRDIDRDYLRGMADSQQEKLDAEGNKMDMIFELIEAGVSLVAAAAGAIPWGSYAVPAEEGADVGVEATEDVAKTAAQKFQQVAAQAAQKAAQKTVKGRIKEMLKKHGSKLQKIGKAMDYTEKAMEITENVREQASNVEGATRHFIKGKNGGQSAAYASGKTESGEDLMLGDNEDVKAIPNVAPPDNLGFGTAKNTKAFETAGWLDCNPIQFGLSKMMCDLYCVEGAVKEGDSAILRSIKDSHTVLMTNVDRLLEYHTQTLLWGMGQLRDQLLAADQPAEALMFLPGSPAERQALKQGKLPDDVATALSELKSLPQMLHLDVGEALAKAGNASLPMESAVWHQEASEKLVTALHRTLEKHFAMGGDVKTAVKEAKQLVLRFASQGRLELKGGEAPKEKAGRMAQQKASALRQQIRNEQDSLQAATPELPPPRARMVEGEDASVEAWYGEVEAGFVAAHERHAVFVQSRQRALQSAERALEAAEQYVSCGQEDLKDLHGLWQKAYRMEDQAAKDLLDAWAATGAAQERLSMAVQRGLVETMAKTAPLPERPELACGSLQEVASKGYSLAVKSLDHALWPMLEQVLALERLAKLQESELDAKKLSHVPRVPANETIMALYYSARDGANPNSTAGKRLAARALNFFGPAVCPAPAACRHGGMLLLNESLPFLWTAAAPGDLVLGKPASQVASACEPPAGAGPAGGKMLQEVASDGTTQSMMNMMSMMMSKLNAFGAEMKEMGEEMKKLNVDSQLCSGGCAERLRLHLPKQQSAVSQIIRRLR